jgi:peptidoglycan/xylan/chitin deacetylase (PgdA/CDA1 family)
MIEEARSRMQVLPTIHVAKFPGNATCAVTCSWDDNDDANLEIARILENIGIRGTFYIDPAGYRPDWAMGGELRSNEIQTLAETHEVGSHTWSHKNLAKSDNNSIQIELTRSKEFLEKVTGRPILGLAYPWGEHSNRVEGIVHDCGYLFARNVRECTIDFPPSNYYSWGTSVHALPRPRLASQNALDYVRYLSGDWRKLALKTFEMALKRRGVWHLFGHACEVLKPTLNHDFLEIMTHVANRGDVWYATNGMLFQNEILKNNTKFEQMRHGASTTFRVSIHRPPEWDSMNMPVTVCVSAPQRQAEPLNVTPSGPGAAEVKRVGEQVMVDIMGNQAELLCT